MPTPIGTFGPATITEPPAPPFAPAAAAAASASSCAVGAIGGTKRLTLVIPLVGDVEVDEAPPNPPKAPDNEAGAVILVEAEGGGARAGIEGGGARAGAGGTTAPAPAPPPPPAPTEGGGGIGGVWRQYCPSAVRLDTT